MKVIKFKKENANNINENIVENVETNLVNNNIKLSIENLT